VARQAKEEREEATVWIDGLDRINNSDAGGDGKPGILMCVDTSATPFYIHGSGYPEGRPFPWIVSDFGLVDAIESGIVKIPRLPVSDTTGRPDPKYFRLWRAIDEAVQPAERLPGKARKPKPDVVFREAEAALKQIAGQWVERFRYIQDGAPGKENVPPVLIIVCDNTDIAEVFYQEISGEREEEVVTEADLEEAAEDEENGEGAGGAAQGRGKKKPKRKVIYGQGSVFPEHFSNTAAEKRTIRIDTKLLAEAESEDPKKTRQTFAEELRRVVATVGKPGLPGEKVRCVVSVGMLTEGWDASNVTHVLGVRAFGSQLLCEQVVGRGLRRMDYTPDPQTGMLTEEYVDVYGIPFTVIPFKGRATKQGAPEDKPKNHVRALEERKAMEMRFPVVEGYAFALRRNLIKCDVDKIETLTIEPYREPTATFLLPTAGYRVGSPSKSGPFDFVKQDRHEYYSQTHVQTIKFMIAQIVVDRLTVGVNGGSDAKRRVMRLMARHQLFPQVYPYVDKYVERIDFQGENPCELGLKRYVELTVERLSDAIEPNDAEGEPPLLPILNKYKPLGTTAEVDFKTTRPCRETMHSHINQVVLDAETWEATTTFRLEEARLAGTVDFYARNDHLGLVIPYEYQGVDHGYEPDFLVRLANGLTVMLETKGYEPDRAKAKHTAARRWVSAVNNWGQLGRWEFHVCHEPQQLGRELKYVEEQARQ
jgi:type III restriction enzyme